MSCVSLQSLPPRSQSAGMNGPMFSMANMMPGNNMPPKNSMMGGPGSDPMTSVAQWVQQQNENLQEGPDFSQAQMNPGNFSPPGITGPGGSYSCASDMPPMSQSSWMGPNGPEGVPSPSDFGSMMGGGGPPGRFMPGGPQNALLQQQKVPNENLTVATERRTAGEDAQNSSDALPRTGWPTQQRRSYARRSSWSHDAYGAERTWSAWANGS
mgnify:CR=1 FL=1